MEAKKAESRDISTTEIVIAAPETSFSSPPLQLQTGSDLKEELKTSKFEASSSNGAQERSWSVSTFVSSDLEIENTDARRTKEQPRRSTLKPNGSPRLNTE